MVSELFAGLVEPDPEQDGLPDLFLYGVDLLSNSQDVILMGLRNRDNAVRVAAQNIAGQNPRMTTPLSYSWLGRVATVKVGVDLAEVAHINSVLVAWLLHLGQAAKPAAFELRNVSPQVAIQLKQLRLNHLLTVHEA